MNMNETRLLQTALDEFKANTGLGLTLVEHETEKGLHQRNDAILRLNGHKDEYLTEVKAWAQHQNTGAIANRLIQQAKERTEEGRKVEPLLVADYINQRMARDLRQAGVNYLDTAGNAYLNAPPTLILLEGKKQKPHNRIKRPGRAFNVTGLKTIFALLTNPELLTSNYRTLANQADVALGTVGWVLKDLQDQGYIQTGLKDKKRKWRDKQALFRKWVEEYPKLKRKYYLGDYATEQNNWWEKADIDGEAVFLGGEYAAAHYTKNLNPKLGTIYLATDKLNEFLNANRLRKVKLDDQQTGARVEIMEAFWGGALPAAGQKALTHPILTYADLISSGDPRNREIANELADKFIKD